MRKRGSERLLVSAAGNAVGFLSILKLDGIVLDANAIEESS